jgi:2-keto-myo-inositol isomerase
MTNRREFLAMAAALPVAPALMQNTRTTAPRRGTFFVSMHMASAGPTIDFKTAAEGYARAGVTAIEPDLVKVRAFAQKESPAVAKRLLDDLGLKPVSTSNQLGLPEPGDNRQRSLDDLKWKVELAQAIGADRIVAPSAGAGNYTLDDFKLGVDNLREAGEIAKPFGVTVMLEFARTSRFAGTLPTALMLVRNADHPNVRIMMDTYHFWGGASKFEDLELLRDGELAHLHFEDVPDTPPREIQGQPHRALPGQGIAPLRRILEVLKKKKYVGPLSFESFSPEYQKMDPYEVAKLAKAAIDPFIKALS